jgi:hypothetical protein
VRQRASAPSRCARRWPALPGGWREQSKLARWFHCLAAAVRADLPPPVVSENPGFALLAGSAVLARITPFRREAERLATGGVSPLEHAPSPARPARPTAGCSAKQWHAIGQPKELGQGRTRRRRGTANRLVSRVDRQVHRRIARVRSTASGAALVEQHDPIAARVEQAAHARRATRPRTAVEHQRRLARPVAAYLPVQALAVADVEHPVLLRLDARVARRHRSNPRPAVPGRVDSRTSYGTCGRRSASPSLARVPALAMG